MNDKLKAIIQVSSVVASAVFPAAAPIAAAANHLLLDGKDKIPDNAVDAAEAAVKTIEHLKGIDIADEVKFRAGCAVIEQGFLLVKASLKHTESTNPA
jgi:hypothetical protein